LGVKAACEGVASAAVEQHQQQGDGFDRWIAEAFERPELSVLSNPPFPGGLGSYWANGGYALHHMQANLDGLWRSLSCRALAPHSAEAPDWQWHADQRKGQMLQNHNRQPLDLRREPFQQLSATSVPNEQHSRSTGTIAAKLEDKGSEKAGATSQIGASHGNGSVPALRVHLAGPLGAPSPCRSARQVPGSPPKDGGSCASAANSGASSVGQQGQALAAWPSPLLLPASTTRSQREAAAEEAAISTVPCMDRAACVLTGPTTIATSTAAAIGGGNISSISSSANAAAAASANASFKRSCARSTSRDGSPRGSHPCSGGSGLLPVSEPVAARPASLALRCRAELSDDGGIHGGLGSLDPDGFIVGAASADAAAAASAVAEVVQHTRRPFVAASGPGQMGGSVAVAIAAEHTAGAAAASKRMDPPPRAAPLTVSERIMIFETRSTPCLRQPSGQSSGGPANDGGSIPDTNSQGHSSTHRSPKPGLAARSNSAFAPGSKIGSLHSKENARSQSELRTGQRQQTWQHLHLPSSRAGSATIPAAAAAPVGSSTGQALATALARSTTASVRVPALALSQLQSGSFRAASGPELKSENRRAASAIQQEGSEQRSGSRAPLAAAAVNNIAALAESSVAGVGGGTVTAAPTVFAATLAATPAVAPVATPATAPAAAAAAATAPAAAAPAAPPSGTSASAGSSWQFALATTGAAVERQDGTAVASVVAPPAANAAVGATVVITDGDAAITNEANGTNGNNGAASGGNVGHTGHAVPSHMSSACAQFRRIALPPRRAEDNYEISEHGSDSEAEDKADEPDRRSKHVPKWCGTYLQDLLGQSDIDPDSIFGSKVPRCVLEDIFGDELYQQAGKNRPKRHRGSSGDWRKDRLGRHEVRDYKQRMGQVRNWDYDKRAHNGAQIAAANSASVAANFSMGRAG